MYVLKLFIIRILFIFLNLIFLLNICCILWHIFYDDTHSPDSFLFIAILHYMTRSQIIYSPLDRYLLWRVSWRYKILFSGNHLYLYTIRNKAVNSFCMDSPCTHMLPLPWVLHPRVALLGHKNVHLTLFQVLPNCTSKIILYHIPTNRMRVPAVSHSYQHLKLLVWFLSTGSIWNAISLLQFCIYLNIIGWVYGYGLFQFPFYALFYVLCLLFSLWLFVLF